MTVLRVLLLPVWSQDPLAARLTAILITIQIVGALLLFWFTLLRLHNAKKEIRSFAAAISKNPETVLKIHHWSPKLRHAWSLAIEPRQNRVESRESLDIDIAFSPQRLLPGAYNQRLDSAAPGLFTAVGIIGTFVGLIVAFWRVNPSQALTSISHLIAGTSVAFINSSRILHVVPEV